MFRSAATALLVSAPLWTAAPAQAAVQQDFPCDVGLQKISNDATSTIDVSATCAEARTVEVRISAGDTQFANVTLDVKAGVRRAVSVTVPKVEQACATLQTGGKSITICSG
ncbi:hypothetical protein G3I77_00510 [Streptomyces sp. D2-8]|uniref:hypothetical protein n=1 Tax=Streptomyces sp. D2-8 TaxID=2707767 RepID=UPI0020C05A63|nr:hypothetical protein [Streptomyces sp. D2-8]MCK8431550.1 hypothetical protein [Streptomyces sp. D2-8]